MDEGAYFLLFLQDMFPYLDKYLVSDYLTKLTERISYLMDEYKLESPCDKALLLDYKAECFLLKKDYRNAVGTDNDYMKTTYQYMNNLYARWKKPEKVIAYKDKYFNISRITTNKNA